MSISRENWSALSMLAQQWTMEDEEEVEKERRRKTKHSSSDVGQDNVFNDNTEPQKSSDSSAPEGAEELEPLQIDFLEMLRMRDENRRRRHVKTLSRQRQEEKGGGDVTGEEDSDRQMWLEVLGDTDNDNMKESVSSSPASSTDLTHSSVSEREKQRGNGEPNTGSDLTALTPTKPSHKFVSSVSISLDKNVAKTRLTPTRSTSNQEYQNESAGSFEPVDKPAFTRHSSRTMSFRILKKKEEESVPLQRSSSMRMTAKKFEPNQRSNEDEKPQSSFQRKQRFSSSTILEKMERLTQASQKWEVAKSPILFHKTLFLVDEVSRKRELFEKDQVKSQSNSVPDKQDYHTLSAGISSHINRWFQKKTLQNLSSLTPIDLRHVDISSKKLLFEGGQKDDQHCITPQ